MNLAEDYCSYEVSKLLKENGFDEPVQYFYRFDSKEELYRGTVSTNTQIGDKFYNAPTHQMALKYLRKVHGIQYAIIPIFAIENDGKYKFDERYHVVIYSNGYLYAMDFINKTYTEVNEEILKYSLENLI